MNNFSNFNNELFAAEVSANLLSKTFPNISENDIEEFYKVGWLSDINLRGEDIAFMFELNNAVGQYGKNFTLTPLMNHSSVLSVPMEGVTMDAFFGLSGTYKKYITILMESVKKIDISTINLNDIVMFEISDKEKIFTTKKIKVKELKKNNIGVSIGNEDIINYIFHILPQYLPTNVKFNKLAMLVINDDTDDISVKFKTIVFNLSKKFFENII
jgi:hypothetical protein